MAYIVTPAATPAPVREKLTQIFQKAIQSQKFRQPTEAAGAVVDDVTGAALEREINSVQESLNEVGKKVFVADKTQ